MFAAGFCLNRPTHNDAPWEGKYSETYEACVQGLQQLKARVRIARDTIGETAWRNATHQPPPPWETPTQHPISRAYYKLWEMLRVCSIEVDVDTQMTLHLCEAPGGFVQACLDTFGRSLNWYACSLRSEQGGPKFSPRLDAQRVCVDSSRSNLLDETHRTALVSHLRERGCGTYALVTADGAAPMDHDHLEETAAPLLAAQIAVALAVLAQGGSLVVKFFEGCRFETCQLLYRAAMDFEDVTIIKPTHSRPTNSEIYFVGCGFCAHSSSDESDAPMTPSGAWTQEYLNTISTLCRKQSSALGDALLRVSHRPSRGSTGKRRLPS